MGLRKCRSSSLKSVNQELCFTGTRRPGVKLCRFLTMMRTRFSAFVSAPLRKYCRFCVILIGHVRSYVVLLCGFSLVRGALNVVLRQCLIALLCS